MTPGTQAPRTISKIRTGRSDVLIEGGVYIFKMVIEEVDSAQVSARHFVNFLFRIFINVVM